MLVSQTSQKALRLKYTEAQKTSNITLMNSDIRGISLAIANLHNIWAAVATIGVGLYLLWELVGEAIVLVSGPILRKSPSHPVHAQREQSNVVIGDRFLIIIF